MGSTQDAIVALLRERGPMTYRDLSEATGAPKHTLAQPMLQLQRYGIVVGEPGEGHNDPKRWRLA